VLDPELSEEAFNNVLIDVAVTLQAGVYSERPDNTSRPIYIRSGQCAWCNHPQTGFAITADRYFHCGEHMFRPYLWPEE
jgi:hypothetical protein